MTSPSLRKRRQRVRKELQSLDHLVITGTQPIPHRFMTRPSTAARTCRSRQDPFDNRASQHPATSVSAEIFVFGRCEVRVAQRQVLLEGRLQPLEPLPFDLLVYLIRHRHQVVTKARLLDEVWRNRHLGEAVISVAIQKARLAIGDGGRPPRLLATVPRRGYRFIGEPDERQVRDRVGTGATSDRSTPLLLADRPLLVAPIADRSLMGWLESLARSDDAAALTLATRLLEQAHAAGLVPMEAAAHRVLARLHARQGAACLAKLHLNEVMRLTATEAPPWEARNDRHFLYHALDQSPDPIFIKDQAHRWVFLNQAFCRFIGHAREDLLGKSDYDFFPAGQADVFWQQDDVVLRSRQESTNEEVITPSRGATFIATTKKAILVDDSQESFLIGTLRCRQHV